MADPLKERISLLQMGAAQGKLRPEHQAELNRYVSQGLVKGAPSPQGVDRDDIQERISMRQAGMPVVEPTRDPFLHIKNPKVREETKGRMMANRSEEHTSELQSLMRTSYADFCLKKKKNKYELTKIS